MRQFYNATKKIHDLLMADTNVNVVTIGDITEVDLAKQTIFPLSHIIVGDTALNGSTMTMNFTVICMDMVDINKNQLRNETEPFLAWMICKIFGTHSYKFAIDWLRI
jgi:hypothetical protein